MKSIIFLLILIVSVAPTSNLAQKFNISQNTYPNLNLKKDKITSSVYFGCGISNSIGVSGTGYSFTAGTDINLGNPIFINLSLDMFRDPRDDENTVRLYTNINSILLFKFRTMHNTLDLYCGGGIFLFFNSTGLPIGLVATAGLDYKVGNNVQIGYSIKHPNYLKGVFDNNPVLLNLLILKINF